MHTLPQLKVVQTDNHTGKKAPTHTTRHTHRITILYRHMWTPRHIKKYIYPYKRHQNRQTYIYKNKQKSTHTTNKLDGVGLVDNRPSINYPNHFVKKRKKYTCDT